MHEIYVVKEWDDTVRNGNMSKEVVLASFISLSQKCFSGTEKMIEQLVVRDNVRN
jgi:hypothetical protein